METYPKWLNFVLFQLGWWGTVLVARTSWEPYAPLVVGVLLFIHLSLSKSRVVDGVLALILGFVGFAMDSLWAYGGVFAFVKPMSPPWMAPPWMVALWLNFAMLPNHALTYLRGKYLLAAILGILGGPLTYYGGVGLGVMEMSDSLGWSLGWIALEWGMAAPLIFFINDFLNQYLAPKNRERRQT